MEREAADHLLVLVLRLHWDGTVVVQVKNLPAESNSAERLSTHTRTRAHAQCERMAALRNNHTRVEVPSTMTAGCSLINERNEQQVRQQVSVCFHRDFSLGFVPYVNKLSKVILQGVLLTQKRIALESLEKYMAATRKPPKMTKIKNGAS